MSEVITVGVDLAKNVFQVNGASASVFGVLFWQLRRDLKHFCLNLNRGGLLKASDVIMGWPALFGGD